MTKYEKLDEAFDVEPTEVEVTEKKIEKIKWPFCFKNANF